MKKVWWVTIFFLAIILLAGIIIAVYLGFLKGAFHKQKTIFGPISIFSINGMIPVQEIENGNQGVFIFETQDSTTVNTWRLGMGKSIQGERLYGAVYLYKENSKWITNSTSTYNYIDPRPLIPCVESEETNCPGNYGDIAYHCGYLKSEEDCKNLELTLDQDYCEICFALLNNNLSLCKDSTWWLYNSCLESYYSYYLNTSINCSALSNSVYEEECSSGKIKDGWLLLDSDKDGLTNNQERYFNTAMGNKDTDGDSIGDYEEIKSGSNPLGEGKLGDHLSS
jgi:hypothetical protein